jgi:hypothetical protein
LAKEILYLDLTNWLHQQIKDAAMQILINLLKYRAVNAYTLLWQKTNDDG